MKIVFFVHCFFPDHFYGTESYTFELARHYKSWGHDVTVVSAIFQGEKSAPDLISRYEFAGIPVLCIDKNRIPHSRVKETYYQQDMRPIFDRILKKLRPDIVHVTHLINHTAALLEVTQQMCIPTYATFTDFFGFCLNNKLESASGSLCQGPSDTRINCVACHIKDAVSSSNTKNWMRFAISPGSAICLSSLAYVVRHLPTLKKGPLSGLIEDIAKRPDTLKTLYNMGYKAAITPTKFLQEAYISNGINVPMHNLWFGVDVDRSPKPNRTSNHKTVIGFIGQIAPHKGTDLLIEAFRRLPQSACELKIYGPSDQDIAYMTKLRLLANGHNVNFMGTFSKDKIADIFRGLDLLVIPSRWYENSPLVLLNALATHTPVLVSNVAGMTEFLKPGINGDSFERGDVDDLEFKLLQFVKYKSVLQYLSKTTSFDRDSYIMSKESFKIYSD